MGVSRGDTLTTVVDRISNTGNGIIDLDDGGHVNLGVIPQIHHAVEIHITQFDPTPRGTVSLENTSYLTITPTKQSLTHEQDADGDICSTFIRFGSDTRVWVQEGLAAGEKVELQFKGDASNLTEESVVSGSDTQTGPDTSDSTTSKRNPSEETNSERVKIDGKDIETLVENINPSVSERTGNSKAGGNVREKSRCKCCGTPVNTGTHKCTPCQNSGCSPFSDRCKLTSS